MPIKTTIDPSLRFYITNFSLTQTYTNGSSLLAVIVCIIGNIVNVKSKHIQRNPYQQNAADFM